jgi:MFS family permease
MVSFATGYMLDRFGRRNVAIVGVTIRMIFSFGEGLSTTYMMLVGSRFMSGVGTAIWGTGLQTITADISTRSDRGSITGGRQGFMHLGTILGPIVGAAAWAWTGDIRVPFFINGFSKMICLLVFIFVMVETRSLSDNDEAAAKAAPKPAPAKQARPSRWSTWVAVFASGFFLALVALFATGLFRSAVVDTLIPVFVREDLSLNQTILGFTLSAIGVGGLSASFLGGRAADKWGVGSVMIPGAIISAVGMLLLTLGPGSIALLALGALLGAGSTLVMVGTHAFAIDISPPGRRGRFFGQTQAAMHFAALVGPVVLGGIADWFGFDSAFIVLAALFAALVPLGVLMARHKVGEPQMVASE